MLVKSTFGRPVLVTRRLLAGLTLSLVLIGVAAHDSVASSFFRSWRSHHACDTPACVTSDGPFSEEVGGTWYWLRSPDQEKRVVISLYNRYCIRCHGVDGRGIWDIPDVPDFTNVRWQTSRSDGQLARIILEGRGAVMPPFRGTLSLEEAWAMARYLRTFVPGSEVSRPDYDQSEKTNTSPRQPPPQKPGTSP